MNVLQKIPYHLNYLRITEPLRKAVLKSCLELKKNADPGTAAEIEEVERYLKRYCFTLFPYEYRKKYRDKDIQIFRDSDGFPYLMRNERKLYGLKTWTEGEFKAYYHEILVEQDPESPHCYISDAQRLPKQGDVIADIGGAEGFFALDHIERAGKIYIFECSEAWQEPLRKTFAPWANKVEIIEKYIGASDDEIQGIVTLDTFFADQKLDYIKADIEGMETDMLRGGRNVMTSKVKKALLCAYHNQEDESKINVLLEEYGFRHTPSHGYMLPAAAYLNGDKQSFQPPYLRRGVIYGEKILKDH